MCEYRNPYPQRPRACTGSDHKLLEPDVMAREAHLHATALPELSGDGRVAGLQGASADLMSMAARDDGC